MEITIQNKVKNPLLKREEIGAIISYDNGTPKKEDVAQEIAKTLMVKKDLLVINRMVPKYGCKQIRISAQVYENEEAMSIKKRKKKREEKKAQ